MKYWFYAVVLANVIFFLWEWQDNAFSPSDSKNAVDKANKQILLLSELDDQTALAANDGLARKDETGRERFSSAEVNEKQPLVGVPEPSALPREDVVPRRASSPQVSVEATSSASGMPLSDERPDEPLAGEAPESEMPAVGDGESDPDDTVNVIGRATAFPEDRTAGASSQENIQDNATDRVMAVSSAVEASTSTPSPQIGGDAIGQTSVPDGVPATDSTDKTIAQAAEPFTELQEGFPASSKVAEPSGLGDDSEFIEKIEKKQDDDIAERRQASDTANVSDKRATSQQSSETAVVEQGDATLQRGGPVASNPQESPPEVCYEIGPFTSKRQLDAWIAEQQIDRSRTETVYRRHQAVYAYLVYYPAGESFAESKQNETMLKEKGVKDLWLFRKGDMQGIISLGLFRDKFRAENLLRQLADIGVKADMQERYQDKQVVYARIRQPVASEQEEPLTAIECEE